MLQRCQVIHIEKCSLVIKNRLLIISARVISAGFGGEGSKVRSEWFEKARKKASRAKR